MYLSCLFVQYMRERHGLHNEMLVCSHNTCLLSCLPCLPPTHDTGKNGKDVLSNLQKHIIFQLHKLVWFLFKICVTAEVCCVCGVLCVCVCVCVCVCRH